MSISVLLITPAYPPYQGSHTQRMLSLTNSLAENDIRVSVVTTEVMEGHPGYNPSTLAHVNSNIEIFRAPAGRFHKKAYSKYSNLSDEKYGKNTSSNSSSKFARKIYRLLNRIKTTVLLPDTMSDWYLPAIKYIKDNNLIDKVRPDFIYSCSMPNTCHLIGYKISKSFDIPLIMDYGDPWVYMADYNHGRIRFSIERSIEKRILKHSSLVSFSTKGAEELYYKKYSLPKEKLITVLTGVEAELIERSNSHIQKKGTERITLTYGGAIQDGIRDPRAFFRALSLFDEVPVLFTIRTDNVEKVKRMVEANCVPDKIEVQGYIPFDSYFEEMLNADILVFFGNATSDQLPGKIFNYIPTGRLIFYISNVPAGGTDQAIDIIKDYGYCVIADNNTEDILEKLHEAIRLIHNRPVDLTSSIQKYSTASQMRSLADKIKTLHSDRICSNNLS